MEYTCEFEKDGVLVNTISTLAKTHYIKFGRCPECDCFLQVFKTGWKERNFVYFCGENIGKITTIMSTKCPVCGKYFDSNFKLISDSLEFYKNA